MVCSTFFLKSAWFFYRYLADSWLRFCTSLALCVAVWMMDFATPASSAAREDAPVPIRLPMLRSTRFGRPLARIASRREIITLRHHFFHYSMAFY